MTGKKRNKKPVYVEQDLFEKALANLAKIAKGEQPAVIKTYSRHSTVLPQFVGMTFLVHTGKSFVKVYISSMDFVGMKLGALAPATRKVGNMVKATNNAAQKAKAKPAAKTSAKK